MIIERGADHSLQLPCSSRTLPVIAYVPVFIQLWLNSTTSPEFHGPLPSHPPHVVIPSPKLISIFIRRSSKSGSETVTL